jgi:hypothetical protein
MRRKCVNFVADWHSGMAMPEVYGESRRAAFTDRKESFVREPLSYQHLAEAMHG